ncbi:MAG: hypothetical protein ABT940_09430, partial [Alphaproteobacteria bacterium]
VRHLESEPDDAFALLDDGTLTWRQAPIARLVAGPEALRPAVAPLASDLLDGLLRERVRRRLGACVEAHIGTVLAPLARARQAEVS